MALLMVAMLTVVSAFVWWTVQRIRQERALARQREQDRPG
jgi:membrane protein implicated in regulation of membrane protease activity